MTRAKPGARITKPTDWEWMPLRFGESMRVCADCETQFKPTARTQKYCVACSKNHRGKSHYGGSKGYREYRVSKVVHG